MKCILKINKIILSLLLLLFLTCGLSSCAWLDGRRSSDIDRTVLIYIAANNNLSRYAFDNFEELKKGYVPDYFKPGKSGEVLLVYYHVFGESPRLLRVSKDEHGIVNEEVVQEYDKEQNSADVSTLKHILEYTCQLFPSEENGLFLWSHGSGWLPNGFYGNPVKPATSRDGKQRLISLPQIEDPAAHLVKSFGDDGGEEMEMLDLADALPIKYSFIVFDACLMAGIEVVYELKDKADYIISSTAEILASGFPYDKVMTHIFKDSPDLIKVCDEYVDFYSSQASQTSRSATISLVETSQLGELAAASAVIFNKERENVEALNMNGIQRYFRLGKDWFYDFDDYMKNISSDPSDYTRFSSAMKDAVIYKKATPNFFFNGSSFVYDGFAIDRFSGLSTYIPKPKNTYLEDYYKTLSWNIDSRMIK